MIRVCVLRIEGTNCEEEMKQAFVESGADAELVHLKQLTGDVSPDRKRKLSDYDILMFPGGWSAGDYVRAGAIFAARIKSKLKAEIADFVESGYAVGGVCNGFQILVELGLLPGFKLLPPHPDACLATNLNSNFQCRPVYIKHVGKCAFTGRLEEGAVLQIPVAHAEGRLTFGENDENYMKELQDKGQIVFRYCRPDGAEAGGTFPWNPNGAVYDIAGICNPDGNVLGMMPHPERVVHKYQHADWTRSGSNGPGDGRAFFDSAVEYTKKVAKKS